LRKTGTFDLNLIQAATSTEQNKYRVDRVGDGIAWSGGSDSEPDYLIARDWSTGFRPDGRTSFPNQRTEQLLKAQQEALDFDERVKVLKDIQMWAAEWMMVVPAQHIFTTFSFQWPWLHNYNWGDGTSTQGQPYWGSHFHWLDSSMPNRETREG
jgi:ABC-type transport system substrate-binding protein